jgi:hypothetical protein
MRTLYIALLVLGGFLGNAQSNLYNKLNSFLINQSKENVNQRLIAINVWSVTDKNSRELNAEFEKVYGIYQHAKLKGGNKGLIVLNISMDADAVTANITLTKDGITKTIKVPSDNTDILNELKGKAAGYNIVFDSQGNKVYESLAPGTVLSSINQLITR